MTQALAIDRVKDQAMKTRSNCREQAERLTTFSQYLPLAERALLQSVYERGITPSTLARAAGETPNAVHRRLKRVLQRLASPAFRYVVRHRQGWTVDRRAIVDAVILHGQSQRAAADALNISIHRVRREIDRIRALAEGEARLIADSPPH